MAPKNTGRLKNPPIFRNIAHYIWPIWFAIWGGFSSLLLAPNHLHEEEFFDYLIFIVIFLGGFFILIIALLYLLCKGVAYWRHERMLGHSYVWRIYLLGLLISIGLYAIFQERNPLHKYGVAFTWYDPPGSTGSWYEVHIDRHVNGQLVEGMSCGGGGPRITFSDEDQDGIADIVVHADGRELAVFAVIEPYIDNQRAFRVIRRTDTGDFGCSYPKVLLTDQQHAQIKKAFLEMYPRLKAVQQSFIVALSQITNIAEEDIAEMLPRLGQDKSDVNKKTLRQIEQQLDRALTESELQQIRLAGRQKQEAMQSIRQEYARELAPFVGLDVEETLRYFF